MFRTEDIIVHQNSEDLIVAQLIKFGVVIIPGYFNNQVVEFLRKEFHFALSQQQENNFIKPFHYSEGAGCVVAKEKIDKSILPYTYNVFSTLFMSNLTNKYLRTKVVLNEVIYFVKDIVGSKHVANDLHFDVLRAFKFFIYLNDTTIKNGAFACVPGSHIKAIEIRKKYGDKISYDNRELTRELPYTEKDAVPLEGKAGTLIIFDTNVFHRAGIVSDGERWVMRGHSYLSPNEISNRIENKFFKKVKSLFSIR